MSKVITFSRVFPAYHPRKGESTYFVEKLSKGFPEYSAEDFTPLKSRPTMDLFSLMVLAIDKWADLQPKYHTIRSASRWKEGEKFSPRVWSGKPYASKMITIAPDIEITKLMDFEIKDECVFIDGELYAYSSSTEALALLALNDGLSLGDMIGWFKCLKPFKGQIICWNDSITY
ncbi:hypothetical protein [Pedobacter antarcticus]|uniref:hypothetical protein n=1 Tax=Pedobacter antarcticus TaxID=34086 RepID=UPI00293137C8|nr:hypothetical protein [Pedobacter antarcticus]